MPKVSDAARHGSMYLESQNGLCRETLSKQQLWVRQVVMASACIKSLLRYWNLKLKREGSAEEEHVFGYQTHKRCV